jgi:hypothetical protein
VSANNELFFRRRIMMRIYLDDVHLRSVEIPIAEDTTCGDVIERCKVPGDETVYSVVEVWRGQGKVLFVVTRQVMKFDLTKVAKVILCVGGTT